MRAVWPLWRMAFAGVGLSVRTESLHLREILQGKLLELMAMKILVPKKGLEPPHPCGYMDLNHARLPIPPLRQV
jgi:hypothetical protein